MEHQHKGLTELAIVPDMHVRKKMIFDRADAAIILPGVLEQWMNFLKCLHEPTEDTR